MGVTEQFQREQGQFAEGAADITHHFLGGLYAKRIELAGGAYVLSHSHPHTHMSALAKGSVIVETDYSRVHYKAPAYITIEAGLHHRIEALEDSLWFCIHATDCEDAEKVDDFILGKAG